MCRVMHIKRRRKAPQSTVAWQASSSVAAVSKGWWSPAPPPAPAMAPAVLLGQLLNWFNSLRTGKVTENKTKRTERSVTWAKLNQGRGQAACEPPRMLAAGTGGWAREERESQSVILTSSWRDNSTECSATGKKQATSFQNEFPTVVVSAMKVVVKWWVHCSSWAPIAGCGLTDNVIITFF